MELLIAVYAVADLVLALHIILSNFIVIWVYLRSRHVRTPTNAYIFSLAVTDFLVGALGIPATVFSVLTRQPQQFLPCLTIHLILCALCTISTFHLLAIAVDKYLTICCRWCQLYDHRHLATRHARAKKLIIMAWVTGASIASMPLVDAFGFASNTRRYFRKECHFTVVVDYRYLVYVIFFGTILLPSLVIAFCYGCIYSKIRVEERQIKCLLRASERQRRMHNRRKLIRILLLLVLTYAFCWYPLYLINTVDLFLPEEYHSTPAITLVAVVLSHLNCSLNPLIYAYGVPGFKQSLRKFIPAGGGGVGADMNNGTAEAKGMHAHSAASVDMACNGGSELADGFARLQYATNEEAKSSAKGVAGSLAVNGDANNIYKTAVQLAKKDEDIRDRNLIDSSDKMNSNSNRFAASTTTTKKSWSNGRRFFASFHNSLHNSSLVKKSNYIYESPVNSASSNTSDYEEEVGKKDEAGSKQKT